MDCGEENDVRERTNRICAISLQLEWIKNMKKPDKQAVHKGKDSLTAEKQYERGEHPNSQANLQPFERGISGNPSGRPTKYANLKKALDKYGERPIDGWGFADKNYKEAVLNKIWYMASEGSIGHIKILAELGCLDED